MEVPHPDLECCSMVIGSSTRHLKKSGGVFAFTPASLASSHPMSNTVAFTSSLSLSLRIVVPL